MLTGISQRLATHGTADRSDGGAAPVRVRVRGGYVPDTVYARAGQRVSIVFSRAETAPCSERVIFPALGTSAMLPAHEDVTVELTPPGPGVYEFTCQLGVLRGRLVVEDRR